MTFDEEIQHKEKRLEELAESALSQNNINKWLPGHQKRAIRYTACKEALEYMWDNDLIENKQLELSEMDYRTLKKTSTLLKTKHLSPVETVKDSYQALFDLKSQENTLDQTLQDLSLSLNQDLKWTMPIPLMLCKIFIEEKKLHRGQTIVVGQFVKLWRQFYEQIKSLDATFPQLNDRNVEEQIEKLGLKTWIKIHTKSGGNFEKSEVEMMQFPPERVRHQIEHAEEVQDFEDLKLKALDSSYDSRNLRHIAIILTGDIGVGRDLTRDEQEAQFLNTSPVLKILLKSVGVESYTDLVEFRRNELRHEIADESEPYVIKKSKMEKDAARTLQKIFGDQFNKYGERTSYPKGPQSVQDQRQTERMLQDNFLDLDEQQKVEYFQQRQRNVRELRRATRPNNTFDSILDPAYVSDDLVTNWNDVVDDNLKQQFDSQFREGYSHTIRKRFKVCPYVIPSFPVDESKEIEISHWNVRYLSKFVNERGMILPRRLTGISAFAQRKITSAIVRAKYLGLMPRDKKWMFVDNRPLKRAQWERIASLEDMKHRPQKALEVTREAFEENTEYPVHGNDEFMSELETVGLQYGLSKDEVLGILSDEQINDAQITKEKREELLKYFSDGFFGKDNTLEQPKTVDIDSVYNMDENEPEVLLTQLARKHRSKYRSDLTNTFRKNYTELSQYWKETFSLADQQKTPAQIEQTA